MLEIRTTVPIFSDGGQISAVQENQALLDAIKAAPALSPAGLLKIASSLQEYPTNAPLANHLALAAFSMQITNPQVQKALNNAAITPEINISPLDVGDWFEDWLDGGSDEASEGSAALTIKLVSFSGINLIVEISPRGTFAIGVSPVLS